MKLRPLFDQVLVTVKEKDEKTESGLVIPDSVSMDRPQIGTVQSIGPDAEGVKVNDEIVFKRFSPDEVKIEEKTYYLLANKDVLAVVENS